MSFTSNLSTVAHQIRKILLSDFFSKKSAGVLLTIGGAITLHSLASVQSLSAAGGFRYVIALSGLLSLIWGVSELLPRKYRGIIVALRIGALATLGIVLFILSAIFVFWWGMQQPK